MKRVLILSACAMALAACKPPESHKLFRQETDDGKPMKVVAALSCPDSQGRLKRVSATSDGKSCLYRDEAQGSEVTLRLVSLNGGGARDALAPIETELKALMPAPDMSGQKVVEADDDGDGNSGNVSIDLPGIHIHAGDRGAKVNVGGEHGVHVDADNNDNARVEVGHGVRATTTVTGKDVATTETTEGVTVNAHGDQAEVRTNRSRNGTRSTYILTDEKAGPAGYRLVGYEAHGPKDGPLVVAVVKSKERHDHDSLFHDMRNLVRTNTGG